MREYILSIGDDNKTCKELLDIDAAAYFGRPHPLKEQIVRCQDCKWSEPNGDSDVTMHCVQWSEDKVVTPLDFCSYGKRVSEED